MFAIVATLISFESTRGVRRWTRFSSRLIQRCYHLFSYINRLLTLELHRRPRIGVCLSSEHAAHTVPARKIVELNKLARSILFFLPARPVATKRRNHDIGRARAVRIAGELAPQSEITPIVEDSIPALRAERRERTGSH